MEVYVWPLTIWPSESIRKDLNKVIDWNQMGTIVVCIPPFLSWSVLSSLLFPSEESNYRKQDGISVIVIGRRHFPPIFKYCANIWTESIWFCSLFYNHVHMLISSISILFTFSSLQFWSHFEIHLRHPSIVLLQMPGCNRNIEKMHLLYFCGLPPLILPFRLASDSPPTRITSQMHPTGLYNTIPHLYLSVINIINKLF